MTKKEVLQNLKSYILNKNQNFAVLLDGEWGVGKTYFVKQEIIPFIQKIEFKPKNKFLPVYVSLYGTESLEVLSREIYSKLFLFKAKKTVKKWFSKFRCKRNVLWDGVKGSAEAIIRGLASKHLGIAELKLIKNDYMPYIANRPVVLILDDLERSQINIIELMGYINNFVDEYGIKTIIIGNEVEINKRFRQEDIVKKFEVVKNVYVPEIDGNMKKENSYESPETIAKEITEAGLFVVNAQKLEQRSDALFPLPITYKIVKEKLIGYTIRYVPNLLDVFSDINNNILSTSQIEMITELFKKYECQNIRTFIFGLELYKEILTTLNEPFLKNKDETINQLARSIFVLSLIIKNPKSKKVQVYNWYDFSIENLLLEPSNKLLEDDVRKYVETSHIDYESLGVTLKSIDREISENKSEDVLKPIQTYWMELTDEEVETRMSGVLINIYKIKPNINTYKNLLKFVIQFFNIFKKYPEDIDEIVKKLIGNIRKSDDVIVDSRGYGSDLDKFSGIYLEILQNKFAEIDGAVNEHNKTRFKDLGKVKKKDITWVEELINNSEYNYYLKAEKRSIISHLDMDELLKNIKDAGAKEIENFRVNFLKKVYSVRDIKADFGNDYESLTRMYDGIEEIKTEFLDLPGKVIISYQLNLLSTQIKSILGQFN